MKSTLSNIGFGALLLAWIGPWLLLIVEGFWLFCTGHVLTGIPWDQTRVGIAIAWPVFVGMIMAGLS
jgi:hypothetical protein